MCLESWNYHFSLFLFSLSLPCCSGILSMIFFAFVGKSEYLSRQFSSSSVKKISSIYCHRRDWILHRHSPLTSLSQKIFFYVFILCLISGRYLSIFLCINGFLYLIFRHLLLCYLVEFIFHFDLPSSSDFGMSPLLTPMNYSIIIIINN